MLGQTTTQIQQPVRLHRLVLAGAEQVVELLSLTRSTIIRKSHP